MDWSSFVEWGTTSAWSIVLAVSALLVLVMLIALWAQIKQSAKVTASHAYQDLISDAHSINKLFIERPELWTLLQSASTVTDENEKTQRRAIAQMFFDYYEGFLFQWLQGMMPPELWARRKRTLEGWLETTNLRHVWPGIKGDYCEEFRELVDRLLLSV